MEREVLQRKRSCEGRRLVKMEAIKRTLNVSKKKKVIIISPTVTT